MAITGRLQQRGGIVSPVEGRMSLSMGEDGFSTGIELAADKSAGIELAVDKFGGFGAVALTDYNFGMEYRQPTFALTARTRERTDELTLTAWRLARKPFLANVEGASFDLGAEMTSDLTGRSNPVLAIGMRHSIAGSESLKARVATDGKIDLGVRVGSDRATSIVGSAQWQLQGRSDDPTPKNFGLSLSLGDP